MHGIRWACVVVWVFVFYTARADAQSGTAHRVAIGGAVISSLQTERQGEAGTFSLPPHGRSVGGVIFGGVGLTPGIELDGELSFAGAVGNTQEWSHPSVRGTTTTEHRDTILSGLVRIHVASFVDLVGGAGVVFARTSASEVSESFYFLTGWTTRVRTERVPDSTRLALTAGFDFPIALGAHVALMPTLRLHHLSRPDTSPSDDADFTRPVSAANSIVWRAGAGVRVQF